MKTDHLNLLWLYENDVQGRVARWAVKLPAYDFTIEHIKGKDNIVADGISRLRGATALVMNMTPNTHDAMNKTWDRLVMSKQRQVMPEEHDQDIRMHMDK